MCRYAWWSKVTDISAVPISCMVLLASLVTTQQTTSQTTSFVKSSFFRFLQCLAQQINKVFNLAQVKMFSLMTINNTKTVCKFVRGVFFFLEVIVDKHRESVPTPLHTVSFVSTFSFIPVKNTN